MRRRATGRRNGLCLVPLGYVPKNLVDHLVDYYTDEYDLTLHVLPAVSLAGHALSRPGQIEAHYLERLYSSTYAKQYRDRNVVLIGLTSLDIYTGDRPDWNWFFGYTGSRHAVISAFRMDPVNWRERTDDDLRNRRVRTLMNKYVAMEYYGLPLKDNRRSVLYRLIGGLDTLDGIDERIPVPAPAAHTRTSIPSNKPIPTQTPLPAGLEATGVRIAQFYLDVIGTTRGLAEARLPAASLEGTLTRLRDDYTSFLSELGCETDTMSTAERMGVFEAAVAYSDANRDHDFEWFTEALEFYGEDSSVGRLLHEINGLADYAMPDAYGGPRKFQTDCDG